MVDLISCIPILVVTIATVTCDYLCVVVYIYIIYIQIFFFPAYLLIGYPFGASHRALHCHSPSYQLVYHCLKIVQAVQTTSLVLGSYHTLFPVYIYVNTQDSSVLILPWLTWLHSKSIITTHCSATDCVHRNVLLESMLQLVFNGASTDEMRACAFTCAYIKTDVFTFLS